MKLTNIFNEKRNKRMSVHTKIENGQKLTYVILEFISKL